VAAIPGEEVPAALSCLPIMKHGSGGSYSPLSGTDRKRVRNFRGNVHKRDANRELSAFSTPATPVARSIESLSLPRKRLLETKEFEVKRVKLVESDQRSAGPPDNAPDKTGTRPAATH
jgi:hypothetical protein